MPLDDPSIITIGGGTSGVPLKTIDTKTLIDDITKELPVIRLGYGVFAEYRKVAYFGMSSTIYAAGDADVMPILKRDMTTSPMTEAEVQILIGASIAVAQQLIKDGLTQFSPMFGQTLITWLTAFGFLGGV